MQSKFNPIFCSQIGTYRDENNWGFDKQKALEDIEIIEKEKKDMVDTSGGKYLLTPRQSAEYLFKSSWSGYNSNWEKLKLSFLMCCENYFKNNDESIFGAYTPSTSAWFYKSNNIDNFQEAIHIHTYSALTGVYFLNLGGSAGTRLYNSNGFKFHHYDPEVEEGQWLIFPSYIPHTGRASINPNDERCVIAANLYLGVEPI